MIFAGMCAASCYRAIPKTTTPRGTSTEGRRMRDEASFQYSVISIQTEHRILKTDYSPSRMAPHPLTVRAPCVRIELCCFHRSGLDEKQKLLHSHYRRNLHYRPRRHGHLWVSHGSVRPGTRDGGRAGYAGTGDRGVRRPGQFEFPHRAAAADEQPDEHRNSY